MKLFYLLVFLFAYHHPNSAMAFGQVLAREGVPTVPPFPEPLIFHNLTIEGFMAKLLQHYDTSFERTTNDSGEDRAYHNALSGRRIAKRVAVGGEIYNNADQQALVELRTSECQVIYGSVFRAVHGRCGDRTHFEFTCGKAGDPSARTQQIKSICRGTPGVPDEPSVCMTRKVHNVHAQERELPFCSEFINVMTKGEDVDSVPTFEGFKDIPSASWGQVYVDTFWGLGDTISSFTAKYNYRGHHPSGKAFHSQSPEHAHSWCCLGCPPGRLEIETMGFQASAFGLTLLAGSWR